MNNQRLPDYTPHETLLQWLLGMSVLVWLVYIGIGSGVHTLILEADYTGLSLVIMVAFIIINGHVLTRVVAISGERNAIHEVHQILSATAKPSIKVSDTGVTFNNQNLPPSLTSRHVFNLARRSEAAPIDAETGDIHGHLLAVLGQRVHGGQKYGWILADLMIKLGLIGTVIGFVLMLGSVASLQNYDIATMQDLLRNMSGGMRVALFTTLSGLTAGVLLALQYQFLEKQAEALVADITELSEVFVLPLLNETRASGGS